MNSSIICLDKAGQIDGIRKLYEERVREDFIPTEKFMSLLDAILGEEEVRKLSKVCNVSTRQLPVQSQ